MSTPMDEEEGQTPTPDHASQVNTPQSQDMQAYDTIGVHNSQNHRLPHSQQSQSQSHVILGTPRTPSMMDTPSSQFASRTSTPHGTLPRGDVGRGYRVAMPYTPEWNNTAATPSTGGFNRGTPHGSGGDNGGGDGGGGGGGEAGEDYMQGTEDGVLWGTTINVHTCINVFKNFLENFVLPTEFEPFYHKQMHIIHRSQQFVMNFNCSHLRDYPLTRRFYEQLKSYPQEVIPIMDMVVNAEYKRRYGEPEGKRKVQVRTFGLSEISRMRDLDPDNIDQLLCIKGMVIRCSPIIPDLKQAFFRCFICSYSEDVLIDRGRIEEPSRCNQCQRSHSMTMIHNRSLFTDKQLIKLQETPDEVPEGETPYTVSLFTFDDLVDTVRPGDRLEVTGIFRALPRRLNSHMTTMRSIYKTYVDAVHFKQPHQGDETSNEPPGQQDDLHDGLESNKKVQFSESRITEFKKFASEEDVYSRLVESFAPSIWEMDDIKRGILCQLFGGTLQADLQVSGGGRDESDVMGGNENSNDNDDDDDFFLSEGKECEGRGGRGRGRGGGVRAATDRAVDKSHHRSDVNILLIGDPGTSKSQLLSYVHKITPRGIYTSGKGSSAVGLTASVIRDPETRDFVLESGALVLSDGGICCIDEFDKMSDSTRAILHEAMEQQTVSITKAGIIATLNARTSILASANPVDSRYNPSKNVVENINLPPTLLSRFDLIYLVLDKPNAESDRRLARHLVSLYHPRSSEDSIRSRQVQQEFLKDYIQYCRSAVSPEISDDASEALIQGYLEMRAQGGRGAKTIAATPRQLESMIRLAQALAKMKLATEVTRADVEESLRLMRVATQAVATDPHTGKIDMGLLTAGRSTAEKDLREKLVLILEDLFATKIGQRLTVSQIRQLVSRDSDVQVRMEDVSLAVQDMVARTTQVQFTASTQTVLIRGRLD